MSQPSSPSESKDIAAIGIGTLIVFIAIVLVAGIAASVLVQTSTTLEMQALKTGKNTMLETSTGLKVESISGHNTSGEIDKILIEITLLAGSSPIDLSQTILEISDGNTKQVLRYGNALTNASDVNGELFINGNFGDSTHFGVIVLQDADGSVKFHSPVINFGDHAAIGIDTNIIFNGIIPRENINGMVICEQGAPGIIGFTTPSSYSIPIVALQ
jgi:archaeal flagellin FlaB